MKKIMFVLRLFTDDWFLFVTKSGYLSWFYADTVTATYFFLRNQLK
jgi:hypothetical protein